MLTTLPVDVLKLDMQFVRNISRDAKAVRMIELIIDIAKFLELNVVAEGVETAEQVEILKRSGVDIIQGFYFSKPVPPEEFAAFIK